MIMLVITFVLMLAILTALLVNAGRKIYLWMRPLFSGIRPLQYGIVYGIFIIAVLASFVVSRIPDNGLPRILFRIGHYALGFLFYLVMLVNLMDLLLFLGRSIRLLPAALSKRTTLAIGTVVLAAAAGVSIYGTVHWFAVQTKSYEVKLHQGTVKNKSDSLQIALISDLHLGYIIDENHIQKIVDKVNSINPDIVCIAGDIFDGDITSLENPAALAQLLGKMNAAYGVYACLGNHDAGEGYAQMLAFLSDADIKVLLDEAVVIDERVVLAGRRDSSPIGGQGEMRMPLKLPPESENLPVIVLDHQPGNIEEYGNNVDLILSGHTHRGQMFPFNLITNRIFNVDYGYYRAPDNGPQVIVTSGAGTWGPPQRSGSDNEVVSIRIKFSQAQKDVKSR